MAKRTVTKDPKKYTDEAIGKLREEIMSKIDVLDRRDLVQYTNATNVLNEVHKKLDQHIAAGVSEFNRMHTSLAENADDIRKIQVTLDTVSANGTKGLGPSLKDLYNKNEEIRTSVVSLTECLQPKLERMAWWHSTKHIVSTMPGVRIFSNKFGMGLSVFIIILVVNIVVHVFTGVTPISLESIAAVVKWLGKMFI